MTAAVPSATDPVVPPPSAVRARATGAPVPAGTVRAACDTALRVTGGVVAVALAAVTALIEVFLSPLRVGTVLVGVSVVVAVLVNYRLPRFTMALTGVGWFAILPALVWFAVMLVAADRTTEGDILLAADNWVALLTIFAGSLSYAVAGYRMLLSSAPSAQNRD